MRKWLLVIAVIVLLVIVCFKTERALVFTETKTDTPTMYILPLTSGDNFILRYTHSIHLSDVIEHYEVDRERIRMNYMTYTDTAIGMPAAADEGQTLTLQDGVYTLTFQEAYLDDFTLYIGDIDLQLSLEYGKQQISLKDTLTRGHSYNVSVQSISLFERLKGVTLR